MEKNLFMLFRAIQNLSAQYEKYVSNGSENMFFDHASAINKCRGLWKKDKMIYCSEFDVYHVILFLVKVCACIFYCCSACKI